MSHTPGSLGVVEAGLLIGLPQYPREELLAIVLTFRVLDFFLPLLFGLVHVLTRNVATLVYATRVAHSVRAGYESSVDA